MPAVPPALVLGCALVLLATGCSGGSVLEGGEHSSATFPRPAANCLKSRDHATPVRFGPHKLLGGYVLGNGSRVVVLAHQSDGDSCQMLPLARRLTAVGYRSLAYDSAGSASSAGPPPAGWTRADDVTAAVGYARDHGARRVYLLGASMGGYAVLGANMSLRPPADAVVSLSAPATYPDGGKPVDVRHFKSPLLLVVARGDSAFLGSNRAFARQDNKSVLRVLPGANHGVDMVDERVWKSIAEFLRAH